MLLMFDQYFQIIKSVLFFFKVYFCHCFSFLLQSLSSLQVAFTHLLQVLLKQNLSLLPILGFLLITENVENSCLQLFRLSHINQLQGVFNCDFATPLDIVHQELNEIEQISGFETSFIKNASLIHQSEFILIYAPIEILINLPYPLIDLWLAVWEIEFCQNSNNIFLVEFLFWSEQVMIYGFLLRFYSWSFLYLSASLMTGAPHILMNVFLNLQAQMLWISISQTCSSRDLSRFFRLPAVEMELSLDCFILLAMRNVTMNNYIKCLHFEKIRNQFICIVFGKQENKAMHLYDTPESLITEGYEIVKHKIFFNRRATTEVQSFLFILKNSQKSLLMESVLVNVFQVYFYQHLQEYILYNFKKTIRRMWLVNWFKSTLEGLGLMNKKAKIVFLGLDDAGKTTLLLRLKEDVMKQMDPTQQPYSEELVLGNIRFKAWDLGGHEAARKTWRNYVSDVDGIIYLVDSSNHKRFEESRNELQGVLEMPELEKVPIVILGNKIDKGGAVSEQELRQQLGLPQKGAMNWSQNKSLRPIQVFMCSVAKKMGYADGFKWLSNYLK